MSIRIVTIEDMKDIGDLLNVLLSHPEIEVFPAANGSDGLDVIARNVPDLVTLDIMMPGIDGWAVYETLRADPKLASIPVIVMSVRDLPVERWQQFADSTIDFYIQKPFDALKVRRLIMRVLNRPDLWKG